MPNGENRPREYQFGRLPDWDKPPKGGLRDQMSDDGYQMLEVVVLMPGLDPQRYATILGWINPRSHDLRDDVQRVQDGKAWKVLTRLETLGLVRKSSPSGDWRTIRWYPTNYGRKEVDR
jgi:hypothetical protein